MNNFNQALFKLYTDNLVSFEEICKKSDNPDELRLLRQGMQSGIDTFVPRYSSVVSDNENLVDMKTLLRTAVRHNASDLLLTCDSPPMLRINGNYCPLELPKLTADDLQHLLSSVVNKHQKIHLEENRELDFALSASLPVSSESKQETQCRFRINTFYQRGSLGMVARIIPREIPSPEELTLPPSLVQLIHKKQGLILITGPTGSGKSTTMASLINVANRIRQIHIVTIEDPIEYVHENISSVIEQREVLFDTLSFSNALRAAMRESPDIIMVGEMRDSETISAALTAAETGHLVLGTLHTNNAMQTVDRVIDSFPASQQNQIRQQFAASILAVVSQRLLRTVDGSRRVAAFEVMIGTPPVQALIRENKTHMLQSVIETAYKDGMNTLDSSLEKLYEKGLISFDEMKACKIDFKITKSF